MSSIRVRRTDENNDLKKGQGSQDFVTDLDAVIQIIKQKLMLFRREWWENEKAGISMFQDILGKYGIGSSTTLADGIITEVILSAPYVFGIVSMSSSFNPSARTYAYTALVNTSFGTAVVSNT